MRVLVSGGRNYDDRTYLFGVLDRIASILRVECIIEGRATGADTLAYEWAREHSVACDTYAANWKLHGKSAGPKRNEQMLAEGRPDLVLAFPTPDSKGTWHMVRIAKAAGVKTWVMPTDEPEIDALGEGVFV